MLCEECGKNPATVSITLSTGHGVTTRHLCPECMKHMEISLSKGDIQSFLSSLLSVLNKDQKKDTPGLVCPACGFAYETFEHTGLLGCAECYQAFSDQLKPVLQKIHGRTQHVGRKPFAIEKDAASELETQIQCLRQKMEEAVSLENFEDAAKYRDALRTLTLQREVPENDC